MPVYEYKGQFYELSETDPAAAKAKIQARLGESAQAPESTGFLDRFKGVPSWMQSKPGQGWDDANTQAAGGDVTNPMAYLSEAQKEEQGAAAKLAGQVVNRGVQVGAGLAKGAVINPAAAVAQVVGGESGRQFAQEAQQSYETQRKNAGAEGFDFAELAGGVVSPVNKLIPGGPVVGAVTGSMLNPVTGRDLSFEDVIRGKVEQGAVGAIFGLGAKTLLPALRDGAKTLLDAGADLTPGKAFGGVGGFIMRQGEDMVDSLKKLVGKEASTEQLNKAFSYVAVNEALAPIGKTVSKASDDGFAMVNQGIKHASKAYETAFNKIGKVAPDEDLFNSFRTVMDDAKNTLDPEDYNKFSAEVRKNVFNRFKATGGANQITQGGVGTPAYEIDGQGLHNIKRFLQARLKNLENDTTELGTTRKGFYDNIMNTFTDFTHRVDTSGAVKAADTTWANMYRISDAAKKAAVNSGTFSPEQLMKAATTQTSSDRKSVV